MKIAFFVTAAKDGWHIDVKDVTTHHSGTIILNSKKRGPLMPAYDTQTVGNSLKWGAVHDTPASFVWEIGHTDLYGISAGQVLPAGRHGLRHATTRRTGPRRRRCGSCPCSSRTARRRRGAW